MSMAGGWQHYNKTQDARLKLQDSKFQKGWLLGFVFFDFFRGEVLFDFGAQSFQAFDYR